jgi:hypothetical protein
VSKILEITYVRRVIRSNILRDRKQKKERRS